VAKALGTGFLKHGHEVLLGTRDPSKLAEWNRSNPSGKVGSCPDAARFAELAVVAVKGTIAVDAVRAAGASNLAGKPVIDATNPIADAPPVNGVLRYFTGPNESLLEALQREFPDALFVKAFNSVGAALMVDPQLKDGRPTMFICGNNEGAKKTVGGIAEQFGWGVADMGPAEAARAIEPLCMLWCIPGFARNEWTHAFKLLH
jgi:predicted dinucleotide-binding enzyme